MYWDLHERSHRVSKSILFIFCVFLPVESVQFYAVQGLQETSARLHFKSPDVFFFSIIVTIVVSFLQMWAEFLELLSCDPIVTRPESQHDCFFLSNWRISFIFYLFLLVNATQVPCLFVIPCTEVAHERRIHFLSALGRVGGVGGMKRERLPRRSYSLFVLCRRLCLDCAPNFQHKSFILLDSSEPTLTAH